MKSSALRRNIQCGGLYGNGEIVGKINVAYRFSFSIVDFPFFIFPDSVWKELQAMTNDKWKINNGK